MVAISTIASCDRVFGIDPIGDVDDVDIRLTHRRRYITTRVDEAFLDLTGATAKFVITDALAPGGFRTVPAIHDADALVGRVPADARVLAMYTLAGEQQLRIITVMARDVSFAGHTIGRPTVELAPVNAQLDFAIALDEPYLAGRDSFQLYTIGAWSVRDFAAAEYPIAAATLWDPPPVAFRTATAIGDGLQRITLADSVQVLRYRDAKLAAVMSAAPFDQHDGVTALEGTLVSVPATHTVEFTIDPAAVSNRLTAAVLGMPALSWQIIAAPGGAVTSSAGPWLGYGDFSLGDPVTTTYADAFPEWPVVVAWNGSTSAGNRTAALTVLAEATTSGTLDLSATQGLPILVSLANTPLTSEGKVVSVDRSQPVTLEITLDVPPPACDLYQLALFAIGPPYELRFTLIMDTPVITVPAELFEPATEYLMGANCLTGAPGVAEGDLAFGLPYRNGSFITPTFSIAP